MTAVVAGAMTAGIGAANVLATPPDVAVAQPSARDVDMAAVTIPIIDIGPTPGPLSIWRYLAIEAGTNPLLLGLIQRAGNSYNLPGLDTLFDSNTDIYAEANSVAGEYVDFGLTSGGGGTGAWELLGIAGGSSVVTDSRNIHFRPLLGGSQGIGAALLGTLADSTYTRNLNFLGSNLDLTGDRLLADFNSATAFTSGGYRSVLGGNPDSSGPQPLATLIDATPNTTFNLGSLTGSAGGNGAIRGGGGLCLGSAVASCGGNISYATIGAPVTGGVTLGGNTIFDADFATNQVAIELKPGQFSVTGAVGGSFTVGGLEIGRPIPINIQIPRASSMLSSTSTRQSVRNSFVAVPGQSTSDNETGGKHRPGPLRKAVADIKKAVNEAVSGRQTAKDTDD